MKKIISILLTMVIMATSTITCMNASAWKIYNDELYDYFDLNKDGEINIADLILAERELEDGKLSLRDHWMIEGYILNNVWSQEVSFQEWDIDDMTMSEENYNFILSIVTAKIVDLKIEDDLVGFRFLNDATITEIRLGRIAEIQTPIIALDYEGERIVLGVTEDNTFAWDTYSFDLVPGYIAE